LAAKKNYSVAKSVGNRLKQFGGLAPPMKLKEGMGMEDETPCVENEEPLYQVCLIFARPGAA
jgi:hypothetical protein